MKDIEHASINGVEIHGLVEQDDDENLLYSGELWINGTKVGTFSEDDEKGLQLDIEAGYDALLKGKVDAYLEAIEDEDEEEDELPPEVFFEDLIELEVYLQAWHDGVKEGYNCLLVNYTEGGGVDVFSVENEDDVEDIARENNLTDFQTFYEPDHFIIKC